MKKLSVILIAALFILLGIYSPKVAKADIEVIIGCGCETPSPSSIATPTVTPTPTISPTPFENDVCANIDGIQTNVPKDYHLAANGRDCVQFELGGAPEPPSTSPQVLGASTSVLASTDSELLLPRIVSGIITGGVLFFIVKKYNI